MKLIFLDFDGVLNSAQHRILLARKGGDPSGLCPLACSNIQHLLDQDDSIRIVVSSSWRYAYSLKKLREVLGAGGIDAFKVIDSTPQTNASRGSQIQQWIDDNGFTGRFVIIDDDSDMDPLSDRLVKTLSGNGFMYYDMLQAAKMLGIGK